LNAPTLTVPVRQVAAQPAADPAPGAPPDHNVELLRFTTAGSVDDGKSTLIGRLLYDSKSIFEDQMEALERSRALSGDGRVNLANLTDGLRAEREQGITIDVAYRYFATPRRKFIIADTPGHIQYTRNMVTGASTANLAVILIDARHGVIEQTRRHAYLASLLRIPHLVVCVNKMDLVDFAEPVYREIHEVFSQFATRLQIQDITFIPISALHGDNVVLRSERMPWYEGSPLLNYLEELHISNDRNLHDGRFPVQYVIRPLSDAHHDFRGFAGQIAGGVFKPGGQIMALPSGRFSTIRRIHTHDGDLAMAFTPMSVTLLLEDDIDISRGDMLVHPDQIPHMGKEVDVMMCWMHDQPMQVGRKYFIKHTTRATRAIIRNLQFRVDIQTLERDYEAKQLGLNEIGRVSLTTANPLFYDSYSRNRQTGGLIVVDEATHITVGAGLICEPPKTSPVAAAEAYII
jgi:sulfate adenylyltransferase large subunit